MSATPTSAAGRTAWRTWLVALAAVLALATTVSLGRWQLSRAAQKEALEAAITERKALPLLDGRALPATGDMADILHRRVTVRGTWAPEHTVYLDNRQMRGQPGFFVLTPLLQEGGGPPVLVQRGWIPRNFQDRTALPPIDTPAGVVELQGRVAPAPSRLWEFGAASTASAPGEGSPGGPGASRIRQNLDLASYRSETRLALADLSIIQAGAASEGLLRDWPEVASGVEKHYGYAFQWFGLAGLITVLYVWFQIVRRVRKAPTPPHTGA